MAWDDQKSKAYDFAADLVKQLISLATGVLTVTLAFYDSFLKTSGGPTGWMVAAWIVFLLSIGAGIVSLMAQTGALATSQTASVTSTAEQRPAQAQVFLFVLALVFMVVAVLTSAPAPSPPATEGS